MTAGTDGPQHGRTLLRVFAVVVLSLFVVGVQLFLQRASENEALSVREQFQPMNATRFDVKSRVSKFRKNKNPLSGIRKSRFSITKEKKNAFDPKNATANTCLYNNNDDVEDWQRRAPYFVLIGAMKAGTEALSFYLRQHPQIPSPTHKEGRFFDLKFDAYNSPHGIKQSEARGAYAEYMRREHHPSGDLQQDTSLFALDNSPRYLFWSDVVPNRLLCVAPWVKLVALLRNPVDRAFSHYNMELSYKNQANKPTFEERIAKDLKRLKTHNVEANNVANASWSAYTRGSAHETGSNSQPFYPHSVLGRGLYSIQLQHWFRAMDQMGKPRSDLLIVRSEELRDNTKEVIDRIVDFLELPRFKLADAEPKHKGHYQVEFQKETRRVLEEFFEPYNRQLYKLLGPEWNGVWDAT